MSKATNESIQKFVQITRHTAVAGVVAWSALLRIPPRDRDPAKRQQASRALANLGAARP